FLESTSLSTSKTLIEEYQATSGLVRCKIASINGQQPGNPEALAQVVVDFAHTANPPVRLPLGSDTVAAIEAKHAADQEILDHWRETSVSTDCSAGQQATVH